VHINAAPTLEGIPEQFHASLLLQWTAYLKAVKKANTLSPPATEFQESVFRVWCTSQYVSELCIQFPDVILELFESGDILRIYANDEYRARLNILLKSVQTEDALIVALRVFRRREMMRLIWRDLMRWSDVTNTIYELSEMADACIDQAAKLLYKWQCEKDGVPEDYRGKPQRLIVLALGKLGGQELNLSSDVDLVFCYPERGETRGVEKNN